MSIAFTLSIVFVRNSKYWNFKKKKGRFFSIFFWNFKKRLNNAWVLKKSRRFFLNYTECNLMFLLWDIIDLDHSVLTFENIINSVPKFQFFFQNCIQFFHGNIFNRINRSSFPLEKCFIWIFSKNFIIVIFGFSQVLFLNCVNLGLCYKNKKIKWNNSNKIILVKF